MPESDLWIFLQKAREIHYYDAEKPLYRMDFGNAQTTGQVVPGTIPKKMPQPKSKEYTPVGRLKVITERISYADIRDEDSGPSCSLAEALEKQDLFINSVPAQLGCRLAKSPAQEH